MKPKNPLFVCAVTNVDGQAVTELPRRGKAHIILTLTDSMTKRPLNGMTCDLRAADESSQSLRFYDPDRNGFKNTALFAAPLLCHGEGEVVVTIGQLDGLEQEEIAFIVQPKYPKRHGAHSPKKAYGQMLIRIKTSAPTQTEDEEDPQTAPSPISFLTPPPGLLPPRQSDDLSDLSEEGWKMSVEYADEMDVFAAEEADEADAGAVQLPFSATSEEGPDEIDPSACSEPDSDPVPLVALKQNNGHERAIVRLYSPNGGAPPAVPYGGMSGQMIVVVSVDGAPLANTETLLFFDAGERNGLAFKDADGASEGDAPVEVLITTDAYGRTPVFRLAHNGSARKRMVSLFVDYGKTAISERVLVVPGGESITLEAEEVVVDPPSRTPWDDHSPKVRSDPRRESAAPAPTSVEATVDPDSAPPMTAPAPPIHNPRVVASLNGAFGAAKPKPARQPKWDQPFWVLSERHEIDGGNRRHDDLNDPFFQYFGPDSEDGRERAKERLRALEPETFDPSVWVLRGTIGFIVTLIALCGLGLGFKYQRWDKMTVDQQSELVATAWSYAEPVVEKLTEQLGKWERDNAEAKRAEKAASKPPDPITETPPVVVPEPTVAPEPAVEPAPPVVVEVKPEPLPPAPPVVATPPVKITHPRPDPIWVPAPKGVPLYPPTHYPIGPKPKDK